MVGKLFEVKSEDACFANCSCDGNWYLDIQGSWEVLVLEVLANVRTMTAWSEVESRGERLQLRMMIIFGEWKCDARSGGSQFLTLAFQDVVEVPPCRLSMLKPATIFFCGEWRVAENEEVVMNSFGEFCEEAKSYSEKDERPRPKIYGKWFVSGKYVGGMWECLLELVDYEGFELWKFLPIFGSNVVQKRKVLMRLAYAVLRGVACNGKLLDEETRDCELLGVTRFGKKWKFGPRFVGLFTIVKRIWEVVYKLDLPEELRCIYPTFHVSNLKECLAEVDVVVPLGDVRIDKKLCYVEEPMAILNRKVKKLRNKEIQLVKSSVAIP
ncbi:hypothetical protein L6452_19667 [Arctium lappa]|uniref:Uncharacterized protein n=1 Tax=Arctium lappa TaxID=4217 RepID=A0ACB9B9L5_ARCLA|nr:hypothetical protein L6452_19667 [Arctium lappa]